MVPMTLAATSIGHSCRGVLSSAASDTPVASHRLDVWSVQCGNRIEKLATTKTATPRSGGSAIWRQFNSSGLERPTPGLRIIQPVAIPHMPSRSQHGGNTVMAASLPTQAERQSDADHATCVLDG